LAVIVVEAFAPVDPIPRWTTIASAPRALLLPPQFKHNPHTYVTLISAAISLRAD
jgi:hypothetical protein